jgi:helix-turn-helix protein
VSDGVAKTIAYNKFQVYEIIDDYHWIIQVIKQSEGELDNVTFNGVAQYGIEASLPSGKGLVSMALENEVVRRNEQYKRLYEYIDKVNFINVNRHKVTDEKEKVVLDCLLDGDSLAAVTRHMGMGRKRIDKMRSDIVDKLVDN